MILVDLLFFLLRFGLSLTICFFHFIEVLCTFFVYSMYTCSLLNALFHHNNLIYTHRRTYERTNTWPKHVYCFYSIRSTTFVFRCSPNSWFLTIFDIFSRDRQTDRQTDRPTRVGIEAQSFCSFFCRSVCLSACFWQNVKNCQKP